MMGRDCSSVIRDIHFYAWMGDTAPTSPSLIICVAFFPRSELLDCIFVCVRHGKITFFTIWNEAVYIFDDFSVDAHCFNQHFWYNHFPNTYILFDGIISSILVLQLIYRQ